MYGFYQDRKIVSSVGRDFTSGTSAGPIELKFIKGKEVHMQIINMVEVANYIGLTLKDENGNVVFDQKPGEDMWGYRIYQAFCPGCDE